MAEHNETGKTGEALAVIFFEKRGYTILQTNWKGGSSEVDIIASKEKTLHFIEVKTKAGKGFAHPEQRVNRAKINRMKKAAEQYLYENPGWRFVQFDIMAITMNDGMKEEYFFIEDVF